jgi:hypothetical protein
MTKEEELLERQKKLNTNLAILLKKHGIKRLKLSSVGNSIATGFSMVRLSKPLLLRNESIATIMELLGIKYEPHKFSRAQNNGDEHIFEWLVTNEKESEINKANIRDFKQGSKIKMPTPDIDEKLEEYFPTKESEKGIRDELLESETDLANIVIYNGVTGSILDNFTRQGVPFKGIKRDITSLEASIKLIQSENRKKGTNTQIYLCGAPNYLGLGITNIINNKLKRLANEYACVTYVPPVKAKVIYKKFGADENSTPDQAQSFLQRLSKYGFDIHYDEVEYLKFTNNILESVVKNYSINQALINIDRKMYKLSTDIELENQDNDNLEKIITSIIQEEYSKLRNDEEKNRFLHTVRKYLINRFPYDFYYTGKDNIKNSIASIKK